MYLLHSGCSRNIHPSTHPSTHPSSTHSPIYPSIYLSTQPLIHPSPTDPFIHPVMHHWLHSQCLLSTYSVLGPMSASGIEPKLHEMQSAYRQAQTLCSAQMHRCHNPCITPCSLCSFPYPWYLQILQLLKISFNKSLLFTAAHSKSREVKYLAKDHTVAQSSPGPRTQVPAMEAS